MKSLLSFSESARILQAYLLTGSEALDDAIQRAHAANPWFIPEFSRQAIEAIAHEFLDPEKLAHWITKYPANAYIPKRIGIIMAGNVPLVGFHDLLCALAAGHHARIKMSDKDLHLLPHIVDVWKQIDPSLSDRITFVDKLDQYDAVIATGSNNSGRYFEYYFRHHPHILRQNRNGVAILTGHETLEELKMLSRDIFLFFGLGCRNVSRIFVPEGYEFSLWDEAISEWTYLGDHHKYKNNLDYNYALYIINGVPHIQLGHLILKEDDAIPSRIGCVHYSFYQDMAEVVSILESRKEEIQCVISGMPVTGWEYVRFGQGQSPALDQYADGVDTMSFLTRL